MTKLSRPSLVINCKVTQLKATFIGFSHTEWKPKRIFVSLAAKQSAEAEVLEMLGEEMQCVICQSFLCAAHALPCSHTFCGDCLVQWLSKKPHCPTCRQPTGGANPTPIHNIDSMIERAASVSWACPFDVRCSIAFLHLGPNGVVCLRLRKSFMECRKRSSSTMIRTEGLCEEIFGRKCE